MKKLNTIIITLFIIITFVRAQGGNKVTCSNGSNCNSCGNTNQITQNFMQVSFTQCTYMACQQSTSYINSFVCQSCYKVANSVSALNVGNFYNPATNACVSSCPLGTTADNTNTCQANTKPGNNISSSGTIAALNIGNFYNPATNACVASCPKGTLADNTNTCQIIPTKPGNNVSCGSSASGSIAALNIGNYYDPVKSSCVSSCPLGTMADSTNTCQTIPTKPGNNVSCGNSASGSIAALNIGNYYDSIKSACVSSCPTGTTADNTNTCQPNPTLSNNNVQCSSSGVVSLEQMQGNIKLGNKVDDYQMGFSQGGLKLGVVEEKEEEMNKLNSIILSLLILVTFVRALPFACGNGTDCSACGDTPEISSQFIPVGYNICIYKNCNTSPVNISGSVCKSCYGTPAVNSILTVGQYYDPNTNACVASCPPGTTADNKNNCKPSPMPGNNVSCGSSGSCSGCGATTQIQNLFTPVSGSNCNVTDCSQSPSSYNSYVCQSCYQASGAIAALNIGNFYNPATSACVASCPNGTSADNTNTCQPIPTKPGNNVSCGSSGSCSGCGATNQIKSLFTPVSGSNCKVTDCSQTPGSYNSYVCQSCYQASGAIAALNIGNFYNPATSACVSSCPNGTSADNTNTCQPIPTKPGNNVSCGSSGSCSGCGATNQIQSLFTPISGSNCKVTDCSQSPGSYNSYVCQSCYQASGAIAALNIGNFYNPATSACVASCPNGTSADNTNTCQPIPTKPGNNVSCGSSGSCSGCGATNQIQSLFTPISGSNCKVTDCSQSPGSYNSYVCQSCYQASGAIAALNIGNFYNPATSACVASCPNGTSADNTNTCQPIPTKPGNNVSCGSSGSCSGCGAAPQIQSLFTPISGSNCKVADCSKSPSSYNGYVCQSCYQASGSIAALNIGNYYDPVKSACVSSCPTGTTADNTNTCQSNPTQPNNNVPCSPSGACKDQNNMYTSGNFLSLALGFLILNILI
ncbi:hypothetical protein ABPG74_002763 [Tetrahymena malaccensis]